MRHGWQCSSSNVTRLLLTLALAGLVVGCTDARDWWSEEPIGAEWQSAAAKDLYDTREPAEALCRFDEPIPTSAESGAIEHWPLWFEDPFVDSGHGRTGDNKYYVGWEDYLALAYDYPRFTLNWLFFPVSVVVTPPWAIMESNGRVEPVHDKPHFNHDAQVKSRDMGSGVEKVKETARLD